MLGLTHWLLAALAVYVGAMTAGLWACLGASLAHFRAKDGGDEPAPAPALTLIRPIRGLDDALLDNLLSLISSDPGGRNQILLAVEGESDPAYTLLRRFADAHAGRGVELVLAGPSGGRMGKVHNMIEALKRARHDCVVFSDADTAATPALLAQTARAFARGYEAVYALPYHVPAPGLGGFLLQAALNHSLCLGAALAQLTGQLRFCAGAWMGYTKAAIARAGGLEALDHAIADDMALSWRMARLGARRTLLPVLVPIQETGSSLGEVLPHLAKWSSIVRCCLPRAYLLLPLFNLGLMASVLWLGCELSGQWRPLGRAMLAAALASRALVGLLQDLFLAGRRMPAGDYLLLAFADLGALPFWLVGFRRRILWRGVRYRLMPGGLCEVVEA